jgi:hypothetical protein
VFKPQNLVVIAVGNADELSILSGLILQITDRTDSISVSRHSAGKIK